MMDSSTLFRSCLVGFGLAGTLLLGGCTGQELDDLGIGLYFVKLEKNPQEVVEFTQNLANEIGFDTIHVYDNATQGFSVRIPDGIVDELRDIPEVRYIKKDKQNNHTPPEEDTPPDEDIIEDPEPILGPTETPESITRVGGPYLGNADFSNFHIAVIDTGIDASHPDLNVVGELDVVADSGAGNAAPGYDPNGHGTHCAGTIGARADGEGVVGMAPGVPMHAIRVLNAEGSGYWTDIVAGLEYVLDHPEIKVVSMSLGGPSWDDPNEDPMFEAIAALEAADVTVVIAAGNETDDTEYYAPAGYDLGLTVSAYDASGGTDNGYAWFSNYGDEVDIAAPGMDILSTYPDGQYTELSGTSMATPLVAGAAIAYRAEHPNKNVRQVFDAITGTGENNFQGQKGKHPEPLIDFTSLME